MGCFGVDWKQAEDLLEELGELLAGLGELVLESAAKSRIASLG